MADPKPLPPIGAKGSEPDLVQWVKARAYAQAAIHAEDVSRWRKAELYDQCDQWLQRAFVDSGAKLPTQWRKMRQDSSDPNSLPLPVYNEGVSLRENESARLGRPEYKPRVRPRGASPSIQAREGAKGAERALLSRLKAMPWDIEADKLYWHMPGYGGAWLLSYWDQHWMDTVRVPAKSLACPNHSALRDAPPTSAPAPVAALAPSGASSLGAGPIFPDESAAHEGAESVAFEAGEGPGDLEGLGVPVAPAIPHFCDYTTREQDAPADRLCPVCPDRPPLVPYKPTMAEAAGPLGQDLPKGDWQLCVLEPYGVFPRDAGIGVKRTDVDEWIWTHMETVDWVAARWPSKVRDEKGALRIRGESAATLLAANPTMGSPDLLRHAATAGVFQDNVLVYEYHRKPWYEWDEKAGEWRRNQGRSVVTVQDVACLDAPLLVESLNRPGEMVPRARLEFVPWEVRDGGRRSTVGQSLWDRLFDVQDGLNERQSQIRAVNQRGANPKYLQRRGLNLETAAADSAVPFTRVLCDTDPGENRPGLELINNSTIDPGVYREVDKDIAYAQRASGQVEVERGQIPAGVSAATAIAYLKTEAGEKRRPRILRIRQALMRAWDHGLKLMAAFYIEPREYSYEDESGEEREAFVQGDVIAAANPKVDIYPTPDYDSADLRRENVRDMVQLGIVNPAQTPQISRKLAKILDEQADYFLDDDLQEEQAQREWQAFRDHGRVPVIDPSLDDHMTHYQEHGRACFGAWFRQQEDAAEWDKALSVLEGSWEQDLLTLAMQAQGVSLQPAILGSWLDKLAQRGFRSSDPAALQLVLSWRAHIEAHKLAIVRKQIQSQPAVEAPGKGSTPTSAAEAQAGAAVAAPPPTAAGMAGQ